MLLSLFWYKIWKINFNDGKIKIERQFQITITTVLFINLIFQDGAILNNRQQEKADTLSHKVIFFVRISNFCGPEKRVANSKKKMTKIRMVVKF